jgi:hypothetical protein
MADETVPGDSASDLVDVRHPGYEDPFGMPGASRSGLPHTDPAVLADEEPVVDALRSDAPPEGAAPAPEPEAEAEDPEPTKTHRARAGAKD